VDGCIAVSQYNIKLIKRNKDSEDPGVHTVTVTVAITVTVTVTVTAITSVM
jgi:hypothetical protein